MAAVGTYPGWFLVQSPRMSAQKSDKNEQVAAVTEELMREGEGIGPDPGTAFSISKPHPAPYWAAALLALGAMVMSLVVTLGNLLGVSMLSSPRTLLLSLIVLWPLWLICTTATFLLSPKTGKRQSRGTVRWRLMRWAAICMLIFGPLLGQLISLILGIVSMFHKDLAWRRAIRPTALMYLCIGLGWPGMFLTAVYALRSLFASEVQLQGAQGPTTFMDLAQTSHFEPLTSLYLVYGTSGVFVLVMLGTALSLWRHQRHRAQQAKDAFSGAPMIQAGEGVVRGTVALATGSDHAVRIEVDQEGSENESSGGWSHSWTEVDRRIMVKPFYLEHASGERIRVEPTSEAHLMDDLDGVILVDLAKRKRFAELIPGEKVVATGHLSRSHDPEADGGGYRGGGQGWVLTPPKLGPMLLSTQPLDAPFRRRARNYAIMAILVTVVTLVGQLLLLPYHQRVWSAETITAMVVSRNITTSTDDDGDVTRHYHVTISNVEPPLRLHQEVERVVFNGLVEWSQVPVLFVASRPESSQIGHVPRANGYAALGLALVLTLIQFFFFARAETSAAWYDQEKVVDSGSGRLPEPPSAKEERGALVITDMG